MENIKDVMTANNWYVDNRGYNHKTIVDRVIKTNFPYPAHLSDYQWVGETPLCFTMGNIGAQTKDGIRDFCFISPWSYTDRVSIAGGYGNPANVPSLYLHKDAIEGCPDQLPDDSVVEVMGIDMGKRCVTGARIVWIRQ